MIWILASTSEYTAAQHVLTEEIPLSTDPPSHAHDTAAHALHTNATLKVLY